MTRTAGEGLRVCAGRAVGGGEQRPPQRGRWGAECLQLPGPHCCCLSPPPQAPGQEASRSPQSGSQRGAQAVWVPLTGPCSASCGRGELWAAAEIRTCRGTGQGRLPTVCPRPRRWGRAGPREPQPRQSGVRAVPSRMSSLGSKPCTPPGVFPPYRGRPLNQLARPPHPTQPGPRVQRHGRLRLSHGVWPLAPHRR